MLAQQVAPAFQSIITGFDGVLGLLPVAAGFGGCFWLMRELSARGQLPRDWRFSLALALCGWGAALAIIVEALSVGHWLARPGLVVSWLAFDAIVLGASARLAHRRQALCLAAWKSSCSEARRHFECLPRFAMVCWLATALIAFFLLGVAVTTPPTNWDAMSYHLPRVLHWIQQGSVDHFPTDNTRELEFGPWAAFVQVQLFVLGGSDRWVNLPQWLAMAASCLLVSYLTRCLGAVAEQSRETDASSVGAAASGENAGALAAFFAATVPMGMMQSLTPQTDYLTTLWLVCLCLFALGLRLHQASVSSAVGVALAGGLGALTKSTFYLYAAPFVLVCAVWFWRAAPDRVGRIKLAGLVLTLFLLLNAPHMLRNYLLLGSPIGSPAVHQMVCNERITLGTFASNLVRNLALHNNCGVPFLTRWLNSTALTVHSWTGQALDDPQTTYPPGPVTFFDRFVVYDDYASAPVHVLAIVFALGLAGIRWRKAKALVVYAALILSSVCLFLVLLKYQVWNSRFHLAYLVLFGPFVALVFTEALPRWSVASAVAVLGVYAAFCLRYNEARPVFHPRFVSLPREEQYLDIQGSSWNLPLTLISTDIVAAGITNVGLKLGFDSFEYPIWLKLRNRGFRGRIDHVFVENESARLGRTIPASDAIICRVGTPPAAITNLFPYVTAYPPLMVLWRVRPAGVAAAP